jgi:tetratricopeptide (TPR) repeat protein
MPAILTGERKLKRATMRTRPLLELVAFVLLAVGAGAQQTVPDAPQPQQPAQKKQPAKAPDPPPAPPPPAAKDDNAFPEDQSKAAADAAGQNKQPAGDDNAFPEAQSKAAAAAAQQKPVPSTKGDNPFPEDESKAAAKAAGNEVAPVPAVPMHDPARSKKDDEVGKFYLAKGDYKGALLRYQDATATDPTNVDAIFGLAETQHNLKQNADALKNYELYLKIVPNGPKAKQALKGLKEIAEGK